MSEMIYLGSIVLPFGKHKGKTLDELPIPYLEWLAENVTNGPMAETISEYWSLPITQRRVEKYWEEQEGGHVCGDK